MGHFPAFSKLLFVRGEEVFLCKVVFDLDVVSELFVCFPPSSQSESVVVVIFMDIVMSYTSVAKHVGGHWEWHAQGVTCFVDCAPICRASSTNKPQVSALI